MNFPGTRPQAEDKSVRVIQITDSHLFAELNAHLVGMNCQQSLKDVIDLVCEQQTNIDCLLCTGDLVQDASISAYQRLESLLSRIKAPSLWVPGNHDSLANIRAAIGKDSVSLNHTRIIGNWKVIMLNSCVEGMIHGQLSEKELAMLDRELANSENKSLHVLIGVHHNAVPIKSKWLQCHALKNSDEFFKVLDKYSHVRAVICGHIHQNLEKERNSVLMLGSPSTCIQFHPDSDDFKLDELNPGYRWLELGVDGSITTGVERVAGKSYNVDFSSDGY